MSSSATDDARRQAWYEGQVVAYCGLVKAGKPVASSQMPTALVPEMVDVCGQQGCRCYVHVSDQAPEWSLMFIYQRPMMLDVIKHSIQLDDSSALGIWFKGCMYGYSLSAIEQMAESSGLDAAAG